jgi:pyruvate formate lyase activating enzyme
VKQTCGVCPRRCALEDGQTGFCRARENRGGKIVCGNYARITSIALDPIEKKPLRRFFPGSYVLSVGSYGCNLNCPFCQNNVISMAGEGESRWRTIEPEQLVAQAKALRVQGCAGLAFTYNEPLVGYEYVRDCAILAKAAGLKTVLVTNGMAFSGPWLELLPFIDAANIDLKGFSQAAYDAVGGDLETVKTAIALAVPRIHVEVTTLAVPGLSDGEDMMREQAKWLAGLSSEIPLHITRFFPMHRMRRQPPTPIETISRLVGIAQESLSFVYKGNC